MNDPIPRLFVLRRDRDVTGVSGLGDVADGVQWPDGSVVLRWRERPSTAVWASLELMLSVHGHDGATRVVWTDEASKGRAVLASALGRAYRLADRWEAAHGGAMSPVRAAGVELREVLDGDAPTVPGQRCGEECAEGHVYAGRCEQAGRHESQCRDRCRGATGIRGLLEHVGIDTRGRDITVAGRLVDAAEAPSGQVASGCASPDHACGTCGECAYEHPGEGGCPEAAETVHACPPEGSGLTPCCGRTPFELPLTDRISSEAPVTCQGATADRTPDTRADKNGPEIPNHQVNEGESSDSGPDTVTDPAWLHEQYARAIKSVRMRVVPDPIVMTMIQAGSGFHLKDEEARPLAAAVMRVRDRAMEALHQRLALAAAVRQDDIKEINRLTSELQRYTEAESADAAAGSYAQRAEQAEQQRDAARDRVEGEKRRGGLAEAAIERVRELHRPVEHRGRTICGECSAYDAEYDTTDGSPIEFEQCSTRLAIGNTQLGANDRQACPYCHGAPQFLRSELQAHVEEKHARVLAALARGLSLDEQLADPETRCRLPHEMET